MEWKLLATVFIAIFIAELGDKTQLATMLFAADRPASKWLVFAGASAALIASSAIGVLAGGLMANYVSGKVISWIAGAGFIIIGVVILLRA